MKRYAILTLMLLFVLAGTVLAQESITPGTPVEGTFNGEAVTYAIDATQGQLLIASMESETFDTYLSIMEGDEEIASDDDSGTDYNALLAFVAQADGTLTLSAGAPFYNDETGDYTLTVDLVDPVAAEINQPVTLTPDAEGSAQLYATFAGTAGQVVNLTATSATDEDIALTLFGVDAVSIDRDDDDGSGNNALLRRVVLPADGIYLLTVAHSYSDDPILESVDVLVEETAQLFLSETPQPLVLGNGEGQIGTEVYTVEVEAGTTYRFIFTIQPLPDEEGGINLELLDTARFFDPELDVQHATRVSWDFVPNASGTIRLDVHPNLFANDLQSIEYTAALEVIAE